MKIKARYVIEIETDVINMLDIKTDKIQTVPSYVAVQKNNILAYGEAALQWIENSNVQTVNPFKEYRINNEYLASAFISYLLKDVLKVNKLFKQSAMLIIPYDTYKSDKILLQKLFTKNGFKNCYLMESQMATAVGCDVNIGSDKSNIVVIVEKDIVRVTLIQSDAILYVKNIEYKEDVSVISSLLLKELTHIIDEKRLNLATSKVTIVDKTEDSLDVNYLKNNINIEVVKCLLKENPAITGVKKILASLKLY